MATAVALAERARGRTFPNPNVGCIVVRDGRVVGRGWTQPGGRPHAEAMALQQAGEFAAGATLYVTLEPCAHISERGPMCAELIAAAGLARVVVAIPDPDLRTNGKGIAMLQAASIDVRSGDGEAAARRAMAGFLMRLAHGRPHVTLKLALSLDGCIATADGRSRWITGDAARAHAHLERARHEAIVVGRGTREADAPKLDVRLPGLEDRSPRRYVLGRSADLRNPDDIASLPADHVLVEGGAGAAAAFLRADLVDRLLLYTAPIIIGGGKPAIGDIGLTDLTTAHGRWKAVDTRCFGKDRLDIYARTRE